MSKPVKRTAHIRKSENDEILPILTHQMEYIEQLEKENRYVKEELLSFKKRLEEVVRENQAIHDTVRSGLVNQTIDKATLVATENVKDLEQQFDGSSDNRNNMHRDSVAPADERDQAFKQWRQEMENIKAIYEAKLQGVDAEMKTTKKDLENALAEGEELKERLEKMDTLLRMPSSAGMATSTRGLNREPISLNANVPLIERLTKERDDLMKSVSSTRNSLLEAQKQEAHLRQELQRSFSAVEDMNLEKARVKMENDRLKKDMELTRQRLETEISSTQKRIADTAAQQRRACQEEMNTLLKKVGELTATVGAYENNLEAAGREKSMLTTQLDDARRQLLIANEDLGKMRSEIEHEVRSTIKGYKGAEDELRETRSRLQQELMKNNQERVRLEQEGMEQQQRLSAAQADALASKELNVTLTQQLNDALHKLQDLRQEKEKICDENKKNFDNLQTESEEKEARLVEVLHKSEIEYEQRLSDLESISSKQSNLIQRLKKEGKTLETELRRVTKKYRSEVGTLSQEKDAATVRLTRLLVANKELEEQVVQHGITHREMQVRLRELDERTRQSTGYATTVMEENDRLVQDRSLLQREVEFLQSQVLPPDSS